MRPTHVRETIAIKTAIERALEAAFVSERDLLRLKAIARLYARGLTGGLTWADLLHEAVARALEGSRRCPPDVEIVPFLACVMRSLRAEYWRQRRREAETFTSRNDLQHDALAAVRDPASDPERQLAALQQLSALDRLFADDLPALEVLSGLGEGLTPEEIQKTYGISKTDYESTRKRMRRALLRDGLAWRRA